MNTTTMDAHGGHAPGPRPALDGRYRELAAGIAYLLAVGTVFTTVLSLGLIAFVGE